MTNLNESNNCGWPIRKLDETSINRIAAGEVIERPAAVVKELIENAIDASATSIKISFSHGGKSFIKVIDNGWGIRKEELKLALTSHATSKMNDNDLLNIKTLGFRGEALPSIAAVSKLTLKSRIQGAMEASEINCRAGKFTEIKPVGLSFGTVVEIFDLFYSTPARLKFLKSDRAETQAIFDSVKRLALSNPDIRFLLQDITKEPKRIFLDLAEEKLESKYFDRIEKVLGASFSENCVELDYEKDGYSLYGYASLPTNSHGTSTNQHFFVNGRLVKDKLLFSALRIAYFDFISKDRFPAVVIFINCDASIVDVNVHPMKSEVRFKYPKDVRSLIISSVKNSLSRNGLKSNSVLTARMLKSFAPENSSFLQTDIIGLNTFGDHKKINKQMSLANDSTWFSGKVESDLEEDSTEHQDFPLGVAKAQLHKNFIVSQSKNGLILVDQHAAHERITYEQLKQQFKMKRVDSQDLLIPEIVELSGNQKEIILEFSDILAKTGFVVDAFGEKAVCVRSIPALLGLSDLKNLIGDLIEEVLVLGQFHSLERRVDAIISRVSCHGSIRSGRTMNAKEMNCLLRQMESTPFSSQCNHGRPTFIELKLADVEKLFGRS
ncbi:MAG: DNA mismatch repair endonuclease MutL [Paracoccaceae bacterium]|nr:DNA mismatch repair endonuclease MutL [Paracoccaceae bacterium]